MSRAVATLLTITLSLLVFILVSSTVSALQIRVGSSVCPASGIGGCISLAGEIEPGDYDRLVRTLLSDAVDDYILNVTVSSSGGDVLEAIKLGKLLSGLYATVWNTEGPCDSACVFVLVGGRSRIVFPVSLRIGLHRPFFDRSYFAGLTVDQAEEKYKELTTLVRDYLSARHVPQATTDRMFDTASPFVSYLSGEDVARGALGHGDPAFDEWLTARCGAIGKEDLEAFLYCQKKGESDPACSAIMRQWRAHAMCEGREITAEVKKVLDQLRQQSTNPMR
jgi:hypothetical protein